MQQESIFSPQEIVRNQAKEEAEVPSCRSTCLKGKSGVEGLRCQGQKPDLMG